MVEHIQEWRLKRLIGGKARRVVIHLLYHRQAVSRLQERLKQPQGFSSYGQVQQWLEQECAVSAAYHTVHSLVRYKLQAKLKKPRPKSSKQNPQAIAQFKKTLHLP